jgi:hypothetical protein
VRSFDPWNCAMKIQESFWDFNSQHGSSFVSVRVHSLTLFALPGACKVIPESPSWPVTFQPPCFGHEPKARVATYTYKCFCRLMEYKELGFAILC